MKTKKIICLYGGPGSGKSTTCAGIFYKLKLMRYDVEMVREYVKEWAWEKRPVMAGDQTYFFAKQSRKERVYIENQLDFIITDSPLILTHFYGMKYDELEQLCNTSLTMLKNHHQFIKTKGYKVEHFVLTRDEEYNQQGRYQTAEEAKRFDKEIVELLDQQGIKYHKITGIETAAEEIIKILSEK